MNLRSISERKFLPSPGNWPFLAEGLLYINLMTRNWCFCIHAMSFTKQIKVSSPKQMVVKSTTTNVVVTMTFLTSSSNSRWSDSAYAIAPLKPENHIITIIFFVILWVRNRLLNSANGNMFKALPSNIKMVLQMINAVSTRCGKL